MGLKFFNKKSYPDMAEALGAIRKELKALWDRDSGVTETTSMSTQQSYMPTTDSGTLQYEYNGPYKLILDGDRVRIVDGATYNPETKTSKDMLVYVNQKKYYAKPFVSEVKTADATFALRFTSPTDENGKDTDVEPIVEVVDLSIEHNNLLPDDTAQYVWHRIGRLFVSNIDGKYSYRVSQDHMSGDVSLEWYMPCWGGEV
jgi:hypothetical protein